jgi:hypothetical protein
LVVSLQELRGLLSVWVWNYNGTPHGGLRSARTPLEAMTAAIRGRRTLLRHLPLSLRSNICLLQSVHPARVRGNINRGEKAAHQLLSCALHEPSVSAIAGVHRQDPANILFRGRHSHLARISRRWHRARRIEGGRHLGHDAAFARYAPTNLPRQATAPIAVRRSGRSGWRLICSSSAARPSVRGRRRVRSRRAIRSCWVNFRVPCCTQLERLPSRAGDPSLVSCRINVPSGAGARQWGRWPRQTERPIAVCDPPITFEIGGNLSG